MLYIYIWFYHVVIMFDSLFDACSRNSSNLHPASLPHLDRSASAKARHSAQPCDVSSAVDIAGAPLRNQILVPVLGILHWHDLACHIPKLWTKSRAIANKEYGVAGLVLQSQRVPEIRGVRTQHDAHWRRPEDRPLRFDPAAIAQRWFKLISWI